MLKDKKVTLRHEQQKLLDLIPTTNDWVELRKKQVEINDLSALTAATGDEFALFSGANSKILIHGSGSSWNIPKDAWDQIKENKFIWEAHSHPTITNLNPSADDIDTLKLFTWQEKSCIIDLNNEKIYFSAEVQDWFNAILGVKKYDK